MAHLMPRPSSLVIAGALLLGACVTHAPVRTVTPPPPTADATPYGLFLAGLSAMNEGRMDAASDYLARASALEGAPIYLQEKAFAAALTAGEVSEAAALAEAAPAVGDADESALSIRRLGALTIGVEAMAQGRYRAAYKALTGPDVGSAQRTSASLLAAWAAAGAGDKAAVKAADPGGDPVAQFVADLDRAELLERTGKSDLAEAEFKARLKSGDAGGLVALAYGGLLERHGRWSEAEALYRKVLNRNPGDPVFVAAAARAAKRGPAPPQVPVRQGAAQALIIPAAGLIAQKQNDTALQYLRLALRLDPADDEAWVLVGDLLAVSGDQEGARAAYARPRPGAERFVAARGKLAWSFEEAGDGPQALKLAADTVQSAPGSREAAMTLAELLRDNGEYQKSADAVTRLIDQDANPDWRLYYLRAAAYDGAGQWPRAEADLQAALKLRPDSPDLLNYLGYAWVDRGEHLKEALAMVQKAADEEPQSGAIVDSLGWAFYRLGDYRAAAAKLEEAVGLEPADADVNDHLGDAYWRVGRKIEARFQWRRVLTLDPTEALKARVEAKLASALGPDAVRTAPTGPVLRPAPSSASAADEPAQPGAR